MNRLNILLATFLLIACNFIVQDAFAFGYVVEHVMYENSKQQLLSEKESQNLEKAKSIHNEMVKQIGLMQQVRSSLGDTRVMYEKDRLIGTLKDYDTVMRSLLYFQTRDAGVLSASSGKLKNANFKDFVLNAKSNVIPEMKKGEMVNLQDVISSKFKDRPSLILRDTNDNILPSDKAHLAGSIIGGKFFIHAYTQEERNSVPSKMHQLMTAYRASFADDVAIRNYILAMYARTYLAERADGNGIGRHLYGAEEIIDKGNNPWSKSLDIFAGIKKYSMKSVFQSALDAKLFSPVVSASNKKTMVEFCDEEAQVKSIDDIKMCIWQALGNIKDEKNGRDLGARARTEGDKNGVLYRPFSYTQAEKDGNRIKIANIRQQITLNTIMWVRATLEMSTLMLLSSAHLELEAAKAMASLDDGNYWINPAEDLIWGKTICPLPDDEEEQKQDDGTRWMQDCLSEQERRWLAPSFDWEKEQYRYPEYIISGDYKKADTSE